MDSHRFVQTTRSLVRAGAGLLGEVARGALDVLFPPPPPCALCRRPAEISWASCVCDRCLDRLPPIGRARCVFCGRAMSGARSPRVCSQCRAHPTPLEYTRAYGVYDGYLQSCIHDLKFRGALHIAEGLGELMAWLVASDGRYGRIDGVVAVPLHPNRERERGYNQAEALARVIGRHLRKRVFQPVLRVEETSPQAKLAWEERRVNVRRAFAIPVPAAVAGMRLLLVDDVYTTGSTLGAMALALRRAGCRACVAVCAAASSLDAEFAIRPRPRGGTQE